MKTLLLGDVCPTDMTKEYFAKQDVTTLFGDTVSLFQGKDFVFVNLECALTAHEGAIKKIGPSLKAPRETAEVLKTLGVDLCGLSNNHVFDYGVKGAKDTMDVLRESGIDYTGFGNDYEDSRKNYTVEHDGERICIIAVCEHEYSYALEDRMGSRPFDEYHTIEDIRAAKQTHDKVIVIYHGGKEFCRYPSPRLHRVCHAMARNGADVVLCQHSHCVGAYEQYNGCHILYGQGNFHFVKSHPLACWHSALAVEYDSSAHSIRFVPLVAGEKGIMLAKGEQEQEIMGAFAERNHTLTTGAWKDGWHAFCEDNRERYVKAISRACLPDSTERENTVFSHFLDCEAHTDVWRELFPSDNLTNEK